MPRFRTAKPLVRSTELFGGRLRAAVPARLFVELAENDPEPIDYNLTMTLDVVSGRLQCVELCVQHRAGGPAVTTEGIRRIPVGLYVQLAAIDQGVVSETVSVPGSPNVVEEIDWSPPPADFAADGMTDEVLTQVARIYRWTMATGDRPYGVLERQYGIPRAKASRWISTARRRGLLEPEEA